MSTFSLAFGNFCLLCQRLSFVFVCVLLSSDCTTCFCCPGVVVYPACFSEYLAVDPRRALPRISRLQRHHSVLSRLFLATYFGTRGFPCYSSTEGLMLASPVPSYSPRFHIFLAYWFFSFWLSTNGPTSAFQVQRRGF